MITKILVSAAIAVVAAVGAAAPAIADPHERCTYTGSVGGGAFCYLSPSTPPNAGLTVPNQFTPGIQNGPSGPAAIQGQQ